MTLPLQQEGQRQIQKVTGRYFLNSNPFEMRKKLKRSTNCKSTTKKKQVQTTEVTTLVSGSSCSDVETSPHGDSDSNAASTDGLSSKQCQPLQEKRKTIIPMDIKMEPIFLCKLRREKKQTLVLPSHSGDLQSVRGQHQLSTSKASHLLEEEVHLLSPLREQLSHSLVTKCLQEIQTCSPTFPVQTLFSALQKKARGRRQRLQSTEDSLYPGSLQSCINLKRKQGDESTEIVSKRQKCGFTAEGAFGVDCCHMAAQDGQESVVLPVKKLSRSSRLSHAHRLRRQSGSSAGLASNCELKTDWVTTDTESDNQSSITRGSCFEDVLWTNKYSPQHSSEIIGNSMSVNTLHSWLKKWKLRVDSEESKKMEESKQEDNSNDLWDCGDFQGEDGADDDQKASLCNTMLITGPPGVGKTASVYACAQELGFKVFEVNCSSQRSGRNVLSQLKEATQSHLVETGKDPLKPAYFKNYTTNSYTPKSETLPRNSKVHPINVMSTSKKRMTQKSGRSGHRGKANPPTVTLANYFKMKAKADHLHFSGLSSTEKPKTKKPSSQSPGCDQTVPQNKKTATSLILFEEVDVIFEDDVGFLAAIKTFMSTTKRPVILTTTDPSFRERFSYSMEEIIFKTPAAVSVCSYLQLVGLAENVQLQIDDVGSLIRLARGDVRRCMLQLQLWVCSGGGWVTPSEGLLKKPTCLQYSHDIQGGGSLDSQVPACETGCTANMLGLKSVTRIQVLNYLKSPCWSQTDMNKLLMLLAESWRRRVPLLYSNLQLLLPIGAHDTSAHCLNGMTSGFQSELRVSDTDLHNHELNVNYISTATNSRQVGNMSRLSRRKCVNMCATTFSSGMKQSILLSLSAPSSRVPASRDNIKQQATKVETGFLVALTEFFDLMSYLDATVPAAPPLVSGPCRPEAFVWTGAEIKDGLLEERSEEESEGWSQEKLLNILAAVEGLGCRKCYCRLSEVWTEAQKCTQSEDKRWERLVVSSAVSERQCLSFSVQPLCAPSVSQRSYELSRAVFGSESFSLLGNRQAVSVDYMPFLRSMCRSQRSQQQKGVPVRYMNFLSGTHLGLSKSTMKLLTEDFS